MIKLVVSDLDGTLIHKEDHLSKRVVDKINELMDRGVNFTFATGRMPYRAINFVNDINLKVPFVANNGSILFYQGKIAYAKMLWAKALMPYITKYMDGDPEFTVLFSYEDRERPLRETAWIAARRNKYPGYNEPLGCETSVWDQEIHKIYVVDDNKTGSIGRLAKELKKMPELVSCYQYGEFSMEIVAAGCSKATGVEQLLKYLNCSKEEVMAIGDHTNDIEVVQMVGLGVGVGNAVPELRAVADYITNGEQSEGVIEAIEKFILKGE